MIITIDGPSGTGKSTLARQLAEKLGYCYLDTGAMYRSVTYYLLKNRINLDDELLVASALTYFHLTIGTNPSDAKFQFLVNGEDVSLVIREQIVTQNVSKVSAMKCVRDQMVLQQRKIAQGHDIVVEGRDMGSVVFPSAEKKFFLIADAKERARRRFLQQPNGQTFEEILTDLERRDYFDSHRDIAPLTKPEGAIEVDTTHMSIEDVLHYLLRNTLK